jgi:hypothetical protein
MPMSAADSVLFIDYATTVKLLSVPEAMAMCEDVFRMHARNSEELAARVDQCDRADMRPAADLLLQHQVDIMTGHRPLETVGGCNAQRLHTLEQAGLHEFDRLKSAVGLLGQDESGVPQLAFVGGKRPVTKIGNHADSARNHHGGQQKAAADEQVDRPKAPCCHWGR